MIAAIMIWNAFHVTPLRTAVGLLSDVGTVRMYVPCHAQAYPLRGIGQFKERDKRAVIFLSRSTHQH